jgi:8-oxo-dGTP diphosphatase
MKTLNQTSSGAVIYRARKGGLEIALIARNNGKIWGLPKGIIEKGEEAKETALREVREETGLEGTIIRKLGDVRYFYSAKEHGALVRFAKVVHFYLMEYKSGSVEDHDTEVDEARWFPIDKALYMLSYKNEKEIVQKAKNVLRGAQRRGSETQGWRE